jgi:hypothetical protein
MVKKRAVSPDDNVLDQGKLPMLYRTLAPISPERHGSLGILSDRDYSFASKSNAIPITADEFPRAARDYPIVVASGATPVPVALVGFERGKNDHVDSDGAWRKDTYIPAYIRRYPFAFLRESETSDRNILCGDMSSVLFTEKPTDDQRLFGDEDNTPSMVRVLDFCKRYELAMDRTRQLMKEVAELDLIGASTVTITRNEKKMKIDGFSIVSEEKLRDLDDKTLADLARRGILNIFAAHQMSMANFSSIGLD